MNLREIKGLGESGIKKLQAAGIVTPLDFCCRFPTRYIELDKVNRFDLFDAGDDVVASGRAVKIENKFIRKNLRFVKVEFVTPDGDRFWATWFNQPFMARAIKTDKDYYILGKLQRRAGRTELSAPVLKEFDKCRSIIPVYKSVGLPAAVYTRAVDAALSQIRICSLLTEEIRQKFGLMDTNDAVRAVHFPTCIEQAQKARRSLSLENLAGHIAAFMLAKQKHSECKPHKYILNNNDLTLNEGLSPLINAEAVKSLSFSLTNDQKKAINHIITALNGKQPANILIEGDVGCGKTIVCLLAMRYVADCGLQSVLMAPTEILARQHLTAASRLFSPNEIEFLCGSQSSAERAAARFNILHGNAKVIIGTHSVFTEGVDYQNLALVITDEQQRFGVTQRGTLENKTTLPDSIVMSATPIPRTLALTLYGDLDLIRIMEKPKKKARIFTRFVGEKVGEMYDYIAKKAETGEQTYIVCPRIEGDDEQSLVGAKDLFNNLKSKFGDKLGLLHGRLSEMEKTRIMQEFVAGKTKILVATVIIEVGIDVPAATTMVIYNAERYGLCQLHQLRGRIGRGTVDSFCFLIVGEGAEATSVDRLRHLTECDDGFSLAEKDFELRGAGDFLGVRQHGKSLTFTGEPITAELLTSAREIAAYIPPAAFDLCNLGVLASGAESEPQGNLIYFKELALN